MNDPAKRIEVEKSSLLSLKVEVLKKQEEIRKRKEVVPEFRKTNKQKLSAVIKNNEEKKVEKAKVFEVEDSAEFEKSKKMLEAKAKYYDKMSKGSEKSEVDPACLVLFNKKKQDRNDLVEFTDCFGRSRKVPLHELEKLQEENDDISEVAEERFANEAVPPASSKLLDTPSQASQEFFQRQKDEWRETEEINTNRNEIFYSNVLFDEARTHGVSYYTFSKDAEERKEQQEKLLKMRENTEESQQQRMAMKTKRDEIIASRVRLAKKRRMEKLGIPYEEEVVVVNQESELSRVDEVKEVQKDPEEELRREMERRSHIRPWDKDKEKTSSSKSHYKDHFEKSDEDWRPQRERMLMTQDEWVDKQRAARNSDFAPPKYKDDEPRTKKYSTPSYKSMEDSISAGLKFMKQKFGSNE